MSHVHAIIRLPTLLMGSDQAIANYWGV